MSSVWENHQKWLQSLSDDTVPATETAAEDEAEA